MEDRSLLGGTMSADEGQLEELALYEQGYALTIYEDLLRPFKLRICQWADGKLSYDSPNNEELYHIIRKNSHYHFICQRSWEINNEKLERKFRGFADEVNDLIKSNHLLYRECLSMQIKLEQYNEINFTLSDVDEGLRSNIYSILSMKNELYKQFENIVDQLSELRLKVASLLSQNILYRAHYEKWIVIVNNQIKVLAEEFRKTKIIYSEDKRRRYRNTTAHILWKSKSNET